MASPVQYSEQSNSAYTTNVGVHSRFDVRTAWVSKASKTLMNEACIVSS